MQILLVLVIIGLVIVDLRRRYKLRKSLGFLVRMCRGKISESLYKELMKRVEELP